MSAAEKGLFAMLYVGVMVAALVVLVWAVKTTPPNRFLVDVGQALIDAAWRVLRWHRNRKLRRKPRRPWRAGPIGRMLGLRSPSYDAGRERKAVKHVSRH